MSASVLAKICVSHKGRKQNMASLFVEIHLAVIRTNTRIMMLRIIIVMTCPSANVAEKIATRKEFRRNPQYAQTDQFLDPDVLQRWGGLSFANRHSCSNWSNNYTHTLSV